MNYFVYITTNPNKSAFYTGVTNDLYTRMNEHYLNRGNQKTFAGRYYCYNLIYYERHNNVEDAIAREKEIKGWRRAKKLMLVHTTNPGMKFLNKTL
ncbi:GIY-YIG nuclease family protein [Fulvivirga lutea]|uniref:GIY-YIG nuclease family protein n=1 Tax=Fulvivirga lutea TaxID=2810512 RepID=A0A974WIC5_9BACT|nr:GIY-YIG nuclease family protein [Fulvivirga lutea]QSE96680.1 GIY-YIG nuclease family protein [Fulvivirga lutea]